MPWQPIFGQSHQGGWENGSYIAPNNCSDGVHWIYTILSDCVWDGKGYASEAFGIASIVVWMVVSIPQMVKNFRHIQGIEGISLLLILMWTLGDSANLAGAMLTKQLPLQIYLAIYFVFADLILFSQFLFYNIIWKKKHRGYEPIQSSIQTQGVPQVVLCISGAMVLCIHQSLELIDRSHDSIHHPAGRSLLSQDLQNNVQYHIRVFDNVTDDVGYAIGIVSSVFYTFSRVGQMWKNYKRKSTEGLSIMMFILAVLGNVTYGLAILVRSLEVTYVLKHLPWLIGSLGVVFLDLSLLAQFKYYGETDDFDKLLRDPLSNSTGADAEIKVEGMSRRRATIN